jgi:hypothetical protein
MLFCFVDVSSRTLSADKVESPHQPHFTVTENPAVSGFANGTDQVSFAVAHRMLMRQVRSASPIN